MGQTLNKLAPGREQKNKIKEIGPIIDRCYEAHFGHIKEKPTFERKDEKPTLTQFYRAVSETVQEINEKLGNSQVPVPEESELKKAFDKHHNERKLEREEFQDILRELIIGSGFSVVGGMKETLIYMFGVPLTALFIKQRLMPRANIPNYYFIPGITSATVFVLAQLNKI